MTKFQEENEDYLTSIQHILPIISFNDDFVKNNEKKVSIKELNFDAINFPVAIGVDKSFVLFKKQGNDQFATFHGIATEADIENNFKDVISQYGPMEMSFTEFLDEDEIEDDYNEKIENESDNENDNESNHEDDDDDEEEDIELNKARIERIEAENDHESELNTSFTLVLGFELSVNVTNYIFQRLGNKCSSKIILQEKGNGNIGYSNNEWIFY